MVSFIEDLLSRCNPRKRGKHTFESIREEQVFLERVKKFLLGG